jgi:DNA repair protein RadA/Sms
MSKAKTIYVCTECGGTAPKWVGQCPHCSAWNTLVEQVDAPATERRGRFSPVSNTPNVVALSAVEARDVSRQPTSLAEFDRVLGGGLVEGAVILIGGDPGIGKSTLLMQAAAALTAIQDVLYVSGEESLEQIALRAHRLQVEAGNMQLLAEIDVDRICDTITKVKPKFVVIDSIQTVYSSALTSAPGSVSQVRECAAQLTRLAKQTGCALVMVGHVTKEGALAGPRVLEHMVDTVLYFEGDTHTSYRVIRAFKNRFGAVNELGVFAMTERGLREVTNPSALFLSAYQSGVAGSSVFATLEGTRPLLVELQALVDDARGMSPKRLTVGMDSNRLAMLLAVLHRHAGMMCLDQDVFLSAVGGVKVADPGADLAASLAIASSFRGKALPERLVVFGEVGLTGEIRPVQRGMERLREAMKLGFERALVPEANLPQSARKAQTGNAPIQIAGYEGLEILPIRRISDAVDSLQAFRS